MPMWNCDSPACQNPAVRTLGECVLCNRHLCAYHLQPTFHTCPRWADADYNDGIAWDAEAAELGRLIERINTAALESQASRLRGGIPCSIPPLRYDRATRYSVMGGMNYHIEVQFNDGVKWLARVRRFNATSPPPVLRDYILQCEVATLRFLESTAVPSPKVFDFNLEHADNPVGVGYILMEKLPGSPLRWGKETEDQRNKLMSQLADVLIELHKYPFSTLGSLDRPGDSHIGAFARKSLTDFTGTKMKPIGPFSSLEEYHKAELHLILDLILRGEMYSQRPVDAYLVHRFLLDLVPLVVSESLHDGDPHYYLKHGDDKGDHILVDEDYNITGIIDWEWAHTAPPSRAFNSPIGLLHVDDFYDGLNDISHNEITIARLLEEKGRKDLASWVRNGRIQHRFAFCCGYDFEDWKRFLGLFQGLRDAVHMDEGISWDDWKIVALDRYKEDAGLRRLLST
ncbi:phosphotransferase enzyme family-domain-containing protein [Nemania sp. FL0031]|nr:phosphotransferase enzyme family-domain-containing protein [Nemania sp. FL0031]